jgi:RNA polymerase sigma-70 factor (ECF subfamily)
MPDPFRSVHDRDEALRAMAELDDDQRLVVVLHYWADLTLQDIATRVGWPIGTVKTRLHHGLERMRRQLGPAVGEPREAGG